MKKILIFLSFLLSLNLVDSQINRNKLRRLTDLTLEASELIAGTPTVGTCGTSPTVNGTNSNGTITVGSGVVTTCTLSFSVTLSAVPICIASSSSGSISTGITSISTSSVVIGLSATLGSGTIYYHCRAK